MFVVQRPKEMRRASDGWTINIHRGLQRLDFKVKAFLHPEVWPGGDLGHILVLLTLKKCVEDIINERGMLSKSEGITDRLVQKLI
jgi:hypothetical protein